MRASPAALRFVETQLIIYRRRWKFSMATT